MVLINILLSFYITAVAVAIMMRISALQVPSLDKVSPYMKFDTYSSISPSVIMLELLLCMLFTMQLDHSVLTTMMLALATRDFVRYFSSLLLPHQIAPKLASPGQALYEASLLW